MKYKAIVLIENGDWFCFKKSQPLYEAAEFLKIKTIRIAKTNRFKHQNEISIISDFMDIEKLYLLLQDLNCEIIEIISTSDFLFTHSLELKKRFKLLAETSIALKISDKNKIFEMLRLHRLPHLKQCTPTQEKDFKQFGSEKLILKPSVSTGGLKRRPWDYKIIDHISNMDSELKNEIFEHNLKGNEKTIVQEFIEHPNCLDIHFVLDSNSTSHVFLEAITNTYHKKNSFLILESWGQISLPENIQKKIKKYLLMIESTKLKNIIMNAQFVIFKDEIYLIDLNLRCAGIWAVLYRHMMPNFFSEYLKMILKKKFAFEHLKKFYLKCPIYLSTGKKIKKLNWPSAEFAEELLYRENIKAGDTVSDNFNSIQPSPQVFFIADSLQECSEKGKKFFDKIWSCPYFDRTHLHKA